MVFFFFNESLMISEKKKNIRNESHKNGNRERILTRCIQDEHKHEIAELVYEILKINSAVGI